MGIIMKCIDYILPYTCICLDISLQVSLHKKNINLLIGKQRSSFCFTFKILPSSYVIESTLITHVLPFTGTITQLSDFDHGAKAFGLYLSFAHVQSGTHRKITFLAGGRFTKCSNLTFSLFIE